MCSVCDLAFSIGMSRRLVNGILPPNDHCCHFTVACYCTTMNGGTRPLPDQAPVRHGPKKLCDLGCGVLLIFKTKIIFEIQQGILECGNDRHGHSGPV